jgi:predicted phage tail protein
MTEQHDIPTAPLSGSGGGGGGKDGGGGGQRTPSTAGDNLNSTQYAQVLDLISEGEIQGLKDGLKSIYLDNTPLQNADNTYNFQNVTVQTRNGTQAQSYIPGFTDIENEVPVGVTVTLASPVARTITDSSVNAVRITITVPQLQKIEDNGDINGTSVLLAVEVQYNGGGYTEVLRDTIAGRTGDNYQRDYLVSLSGNFPVNVRVLRGTPDSSDPRLSNAFSWSSYTQIKWAALAYPNSALVALRVDAEQFNRIPQRSYLVRGIKVRIPSNATVDSTTGRLTYAGIWNGTFGAAQWCSDPAWILYDLLLSQRYGFGDYIAAAQLDKFSFYTASVYASALVSDGFGGQEPRFSCNVNIQTAEDAYKLINDLCSVFRVMPYWSIGALSVSQDAPADPSYLFTLANVTEEGFTYAGSSLKTRPTVAIVSYLDLELRDIAKEVVEDSALIAKYGYNTVELSAFACTSRGQANRLGKWYVYSESHGEVINFTASVDAGVLVRPGQIIEVADPVRAGSRRAGRIRSATTTTVTVDDATGLTYNATGVLSVLLPDGTLQSRGVTALSGGGMFTVSPAFSAAPNANSVWGYETSDLLTSLWRVLAVQEQDGTSYAITALEHNASKYAFVEQGLALQVRDTTNLNEIPAAPTNIEITEALYLYQSQVRAKIIAGWRPVDNVNQYRVRWRKDLGNWQTTTRKGPDIEILDITPGTFQFEIYSINAALKPSTTPLTGSINALGKTAPPSNVSNFRSVLDPNIGVTLAWNPISDIDLSEYEIRQGSVWASATFVARVAATSYKIAQIASTGTTYLIKAIDTSGIYSNTAASTTVTVTVLPAVNPTSTFAGEQIILSWTAVTGGSTGLTVAYYQIRRCDPGVSFAAATTIAETKSTVYALKVNWSGTQRFWVAAYDVVGNQGTPSFVTVVITNPSAPSIVQEVIDNNVLLRWTDSTQSLPIVYYEVRRGATWATATSIGTKQGRFTVVFETVSGTYTYWVAGVDSAGNVGTEASVSAVVNQPPDYILRANIDSTFGGTKVNAAANNNGLLVAVDTSETWEAHFTSRGWSTPQDQINAGYSIYILPSATTGSYTEEFDYGAVLAGSKITATLTRQAVVGSVGITSTLSVKETAGSAWIDYVGQESIYATLFRYVKVAYSFTSSGNDDLLQISGLNIRLDVKIKNDMGNGTANSGDSGGTTVNFNVPFVDIESITVTPIGTTARIAVYDFVDAPNPTSFKVLLFDTSGNRVTGPFSWQARGS